MACRPYNTGRCLLLRLFNPSKLWGSLHICPRVSGDGTQRVDEILIHHPSYILHHTSYIIHQKQYFTPTCHSHACMEACG